jgi:hypothetical protein
MAVLFPEIHARKTVNQPSRDVVCKFAHTQEEGLRNFGSIITTWAIRKAEYVEGTQMDGYMRQTQRMSAAKKD